MDEIFKTWRRPSKVATIMKESRLTQLRRESAETKLIRAIKLYEMGQQLKKVRENANKPDKHH
jgi:hypothetical protein